MGYFTDIKIILVGKLSADNYYMFTPKVLLSFLLITLIGCKKQLVSQEELNDAMKLLASPQEPLKISGNAYFFGDSITEGVAIAGDKNWVYLVCKFTGLNGFNLGIGGSTLVGHSEGRLVASGMYNRVAEIPVKKESDKYLFFAYGVNDILIGAPDMTEENFVSDFEYVLSKARANGWKSKDIIILNTYYFKEGDLKKSRQIQFNEAIKKIATKNATRFIDIESFMYDHGRNALLSWDNLHPNEVGYAVIARCIEEALRSYQ